MVEATGGRSSYLQLVNDSSNADDRCRLVGEHAGVAIQSCQRFAGGVKGLVVEGHELVRDILEVGSHRDLVVALRSSIGGCKWQLEVEMGLLGFSSRAEREQEGWEVKNGLGC